MHYVENLNEKLFFFHTCAPAEILRLVTTAIPGDRLPSQFLAGLSEPDRTVCYRASMICWSVSGSKMVPREMQLKVILADWKGRDTLVAAGTGSGKTLPIALCILLDDPSANLLTITISPLKRLQVTQESDFNGRFGIQTVTVNEDTSDSIKWWNDNVYDPVLHRRGRARHIIVTVEQLFKSSAGHFSRLGNLIRNNPDLQKKII
ncbi:hypothetical protein CPB84DRAFT_1716710 [Gymnopilus junonius]|uniref:DEAD/DEAH-box helicase domain-containing protein n=1 Tax=Gymnopilus junonius TaxID=109634 RepID=A0A9P5TET4_GYMJU|nr:hypothetical protein CPB84DRAFT_1716710 [Gymnopilus junonius]